MVKRVSSSQQIPPLSIVRGEQVNATYAEQLIPEYQGNPLIEALPPLWTMEEVEQLLSYFPYYDPQQRELSKEIRLHLLDNAREFFIPHGIHYEIHLSISNMIRRGYIDRNPASKGLWASQGGKIDQFKNRLQGRAFLRSKARGLCIVGIGGVGKSTAVENILSLYPQVIIHTKYKGQDLILKQLVWLKLQCPNDGSMKSLCMTYLQEVDDILGTNYMKSYGVGRRTVDELLIIMARVASNHFQGVIVFDEIQDLSEAKSGGATRMLNFFVQLENTLGIPFILIGTPKARQLFSGEFRQARRVSEQGDIYWHPMRRISPKEKPHDPDVCDPDWNDFIRAMWKYWYLQKNHALPHNLLEAPVVHDLYEESKGITALVVTIFFLAQRRAITNGVEDLTPKVIKSAVKDNQYLVDKIFEQLKEKQQTKPSHTTSDLDHTAWRRSTGSPEQEKSKNDSQAALVDSSRQGLIRNAHEDKTSSTRSDKTSTNTKASRTFEADDFRNIAASMEGQQTDTQTSIDGRHFGSTDDFS